MTTSSATNRRLPNRFLDRHLYRLGLYRFSQTSLQNQGKAVRFDYPADLSYCVPLEYLLAWFSAPHYVLNRRRRARPLEEIHSLELEGWKEAVERIRRVRLILEGRCARIYFNDQAICDVAWDTPLMACEPRYEHFGGLTPESKALTEAYYERLGPFLRGPGAG